MTLISADHLFALVAIVVAGAAFAFWAESQRWGRQVSGPVWAILFGLLLSNTGVVPASTPVFSMVSDLLVPAAIPLLLFKANLRRIIAETGPMLLAFMIAPPRMTTPDLDRVRRRGGLDGGGVAGEEQVIDAAAGGRRPRSCGR